VGNAEALHQGQADFPLTENGKQQVHSLATWWIDHGFHFDYALSSPLSRASETARILETKLNLKVQYDPIWMERDNGRLAGLSHERARKEVPQPDYIPLYQPVAETGESLWELYLRAGQALNKVLRQSSGHYLIISHGAFLNMVIHSAVGLSPLPDFQGTYFSLGNTGYTQMEYYPQQGVWIMRSHNVRSHLFGND
jgi:2,3-bisphosphoglycerate-dependent phosphoglycerate mutase